MDKLALVSVVLVILGACALVQARDIYSDVRFYYDPLSKSLVTTTTTKCYIVALTHLERDHIHSRSGIEDIEVKMMQDWLGVLPETRIFHDDTTMSSNIHTWCADRYPKDIFRLDRVLPTDPASGVLG